jgi:hypothetical protein
MEATMTDSSHESHHPPRPGESTPRVPTQLGSFYPEGDIVAVLADADTAEQAKSAMLDAGFPQSDVDVVEGAVATATKREFETQRSVLERLEAFLSSDEDSYAQTYAEAAARGRWLIVVHAPTSEAVERARPILAKFHAEYARHYGSTVVTDL